MNSEGRAAIPPTAKPSASRRLECGVVWAIVALAVSAGGIGCVGPSLGASDPGLQGLVGFAVEVIASMWIPYGFLSATVAIVAVIRRLRLPAAVLATVAIFVLAPEFSARMQVPGAHSVTSVPRLRIASVNLCSENKDDPLMEESLRELDADVLVLLEVTRSWENRLAPWFHDDYPHRWLARAPDKPGVFLEGLSIAVWSRVPSVGEHEVVNLRGYNAQIRVPLRWHGHSFSLYGIHPWKPYPYGLYRGAWQERHDLLGWIRSDRLPAVVAGDFNATPRSAFMRRLCACGLANSSETVLGHAPGTWPARPATLLPLRVGIDHIMYSAQFAAVEFRVGKTTNSDHFPVVAELVWQDH